MTETGTCQAHQEEETDVVENPFFKIKQLSEYDRQYNGNKITYLFFLCVPVPSDARWLGTTALYDPTSKNTNYPIKEQVHYFQSLS